MGSGSRVEAGGLESNAWVFCNSGGVWGAGCGVQGVGCITQERDHR